MATPKEIRREIRELKADMKQQGIRVTSCMNRQDSIQAARCNERLFALKIALERAEVTACADRARAIEAQQADCTHAFLKCDSELGGPPVGICASCGLHVVIV